MYQHHLDVANVFLLLTLSIVHYQWAIGRRHQSHNLLGRRPARVCCRARANGMDTVAPDQLPFHVAFLERRLRHDRLQMRLDAAPE